MNRIERHFNAARDEGRKSLVLFVSAGFPDLATTEKIILTLSDAGCDVLELGVPFSDPIADGPTIQASSAEALRAGTTLEGILEMVARVRVKSDIPILLFGAYNPFHHYGLERLTKRAAEVGVDGFLAPDLPIEESQPMEGLCRESGLSLVYLAAPTTPEPRMREIAARSSGFLYFISTRGVTGGRIQVDDEMRRQVAALREAAGDLPVAVGFGIGTPEDAAEVAKVADVIVVGSALVRLIDKHRSSPALFEQVAAFSRSLKDAL